MGCAGSAEQQPIDAVAPAIRRERTASSSSTGALADSQRSCAALVSFAEVSTPSLPPHQLTLGRSGGESLVGEHAPPNASFPSRTWAASNTSAPGTPRNNNNTSQSCQPSSTSNLVNLFPPALRQDHACAPPPRRNTNTHSKTSGGGSPPMVAPSRVERQDSSLNAAKRAVDDAHVANPLKTPLRSRDFHPVSGADDLQELRREIHAAIARHECGPRRHNTNPRNPQQQEPVTSSDESPRTAMPLGLAAPAAGAGGATSNSINLAQFSTMLLGSGSNSGTALLSVPGGASSPVGGRAPRTDVRPVSHRGGSYPPRGNIVAAASLSNRIQRPQGRGSGTSSPVINVNQTQRQFPGVRSPPPPPLPNAVAAAAAGGAVIGESPPRPIPSAVNGGEPLQQQLSSAELMSYLRSLRHDGDGGASESRSQYSQSQSQINNQQQLMLMSSHPQHEDESSRMNGHLVDNIADLGGSGGDAAHRTYNRRRRVGSGGRLLGSSSHQRRVSPMATSLLSDGASLSEHHAGSPSNLRGGGGSCRRLTKDTLDRMSQSNTSPTPTGSPMGAVPDPEAPPVENTSLDDRVRQWVAEQAPDNSSLALPPPVASLTPPHGAPNVDDDDDDDSSHPVEQSSAPPHVV